MRDRIDKVVIDRMTAKDPYGYNKINELQRAYPGNVVDTATVVYPKYESLNYHTFEEDLVARADQVKHSDPKTRFQMMLLGYVNAGSAYISIAAQICLYKITAAVINPYTFDELFNRVPDAVRILLDEKLLKKFVSIMEKVYAAYTNTSENGELAKIADF